MIEWDDLVTNRGVRIDDDRLTSQTEGLVGLLYRENHIEETVRKNTDTGNTQEAAEDSAVLDAERNNSNHNKENELHAAYNK